MGQDVSRGETLESNPVASLTTADEPAVRSISSGRSSPAQPGTSSGSSSSNGSSDRSAAAPQAVADDEEEATHHSAEQRRAAHGSDDDVEKVLSAGRLRPTSSTAASDRGGSGTADVAEPLNIDRLLNVQAHAYVRYHPEALEELFGDDVKDATAAAAAAARKPAFHFPSASELAASLQRLPTATSASTSAAAQQSSTSFAGQGRPAATAAVPPATGSRIAQRTVDLGNSEFLVLQEEDEPFSEEDLPRQAFQEALDEWLIAAYTAQQRPPPLGPGAPRAALRLAPVPHSLPGLSYRECSRSRRDGRGAGRDVKGMTWKLPFV